MTEELNSCSGILLASVNLLFYFAQVLLQFPLARKSYRSADDSMCDTSGIPPEILRHLCVSAPQQRDLSCVHPMLHATL